MRPRRWCADPGSVRSKSMPAEQRPHDATGACRRNAPASDRLGRQGRGRLVNARGVSNFWPAGLLLGVLLAACGGGGAGATSHLDLIALGRSQRLTVRLTSGKEQTLVQAQSGSFPTSPVWSPDGSKVA